MTSDNPRDEDPLRDHRRGAGGHPRRARQPAASSSSPTAAWPSACALDAAGAGDVVVIAGKGHETYQEIAGERLPFDDAVEARRALSARCTSDPATGAELTAASRGIRRRAPGGLTPRARTARLGRRRAVGRHPLHPLPHPLLPHPRDRPAHQGGRPGHPHRQGGHADHGRHRHRRRRSCSATPSGTSAPRSASRARATSPSAPWWPSASSGTSTTTSRSTTSAASG